MEAAASCDFLGVDDYLSGEQSSHVKHEYVAGAVYAMRAALQTAIKSG